MPGVLKTGESKAEAFSGYSAYRAGGTVGNGVRVPDFTFGWANQFIYKASPKVGVVVDVNGHYNSFGSAFDLAFGPRFQFPWGHFTPFLEGMTGLQHFSPKGLHSQSTPTYIFGVGLDVKVNPRLTIRPFQLSYVSTYYSPSLFTMDRNFFNGIRVQSGVVYDLRSLRWPSLKTEVIASCSAEPAAVDSGVPVKVEVAAKGFAHKRTLVYSYATTGGSIAGNAAAASVNTTGTGPGTYLVSAKVTNNGKGTHQQTASCETQFSVNAISPSKPVIASEPAKAPALPSEPAKAAVVTAEPAKAPMAAVESAKASTVAADQAKTRVVGVESTKVVEVGVEPAHPVVAVEPTKTAEVASDQGQAPVVVAESAKASVVATEPTKTAVVADVQPKTSVVAAEPTKVAEVGVEPAHPVVAVESAKDPVVEADKAKNSPVVEQPKTSVFATETKKAQLVASRPSKASVAAVERATTPAFAPKQVKAPAFAAPVPASRLRSANAAPAKVIAPTRGRSLEKVEVQRPLKFGSIEFVRDAKRPSRVDNAAKAELDRYADALAAMSDATGVIVGDTGAPEKKDSEIALSLASQRAVNAKYYVSKDKGIDPARIEPRVGRASAKKADLWIVPAGMNFAVKSTTVVDEIKFKAAPRVPLKSKNVRQKGTNGDAKRMSQSGKVSSGN